MVYLLNKRYRPYYKWMHRGILDLPALSETYESFTALCNPMTAPEALIDIVEMICQTVLHELQLQGLTSKNSSFLLDHCNVINGKIHDEKLRSIHIMDGGNTS